MLQSVLQSCTNQPWDWFNLESPGSTLSVMVSMLQRITIRMLQTVVMFLLLAAGSLSSAQTQENKNNLQAEIQRASTESQELAEELSDLLDLLQSNRKITVAEDIFTDIVTRIQEIAEVTEEENLIRLAETVKGKRLEEEELTQSINHLQDLTSLLENKAMD